MQSIPTAVSEEERASLQSFALGKRCIEIGSQFGASTIALAEVAEIVVSVDWHEGDEHAGFDWTWPAFVANLRGHDVDKKVIPIVCRSECIPPGLLAPGFFNLGFIDGHHSFASVTADAKLVLPLLSEGGLLLFHDYGGFEVSEAVEAIAGGAPVEYPAGTLALLRVF